MKRLKKFLLKIKYHMIRLSLKNIKLKKGKLKQDGLLAILKKILTITGKILQLVVRSAYDWYF